MKCAISSIGRSKKAFQGCSPSRQRVPFYSYAFQEWRHASLSRIECQLHALILRHLTWWRRPKFLTLLAQPGQVCQPRQCNSGFPIVSICIAWIGRHARAWGSSISPSRLLWTIRWPQSNTLVWRSQPDRDFWDAQHSLLGEYEYWRMKCLRICTHVTLEWQN